MTAVLGAALRGSGLAFRPGVSWTIDTPYRETVAEARHYQAEGVLCVEMEAAALFPVAEVRLAQAVWGLARKHAPGPFGINVLGRRCWPAVGIARPAARCSLTEGFAFG